MHFFYIENSLQEMFWPRQSPDLNPLENSWIDWFTDFYGMSTSQGLLYAYR